VFTNVAKQAENKLACFVGKLHREMELIIELAWPKSEPKSAAKTALETVLRTTLKTALRIEAKLLKTSRNSGKINSNSLSSSRTPQL